MSLNRIKANISEVPKDAILLSEKQALIYQWKIIKEWEKPSDVWALRYTSAILGVVTGATAMFINNHYRTKLRLGSYGQLSSYLPNVAIPTILALLGNRMFVQKEILLNPLEGCPTCLELRASAFQCGIGVLYPTLLAPFSTFMFATRHFTYRLPSITEKPLEVAKLWLKLTRPISTTLGGLAIGHALIAMYLTYKQLIQIVEMDVNLQKIEQNIEDEHLFKHPELQSEFEQTATNETNETNTTTTATTFNIFK